ncbi:hypothetical protein JKY72_04845 [Candidatus Gracilibacteria bacterium]|nr:hypothetical protein [Candidatus Gracilibacteria bacterium]
MDVLTENITNDLIRYIRILDRSSKSFQKEVAKLRKKNFQSISKKEVSTLMKEFLIPTTKDNTRYIYGYLSLKRISQKYILNTNLLATKEKPSHYKIEEPSVIIQITDDLSAADWEEMRLFYGKIKKGSEELPDQYNIKKVFRKNHHLTRRFDNIDLRLVVYKDYLKTNDYDKTYSKMAQIKININHQPYPLHSLVEMKKMIKEIEELINNL